MYHTLQYQLSMQLANAHLYALAIAIDNIIENVFSHSNNNNNDMHG